ncbi:hypothetical protein [Xylanibacter oryzae]|uniref:hypothetical protein n=1 Tax=Xylanibacter oryzae TaxID=185293 RepID=UPI0004B879C6|nr:hypothetical protein [Xylanibacter oryzae]
MKRIYFLILLSIVSLSAFTQQISELDKSVNKMMEQAESYIPDFHRKSVTASYPIFYVLTKKEYRKMTFSQIPTYNQIDQYIDFDHLELECVLAKAPEGIWDLSGKYDDYDSFCYTKRANDRLFDYLDSIKPDRVYNLFGEFFLKLIEKNGHRYLIKEINKQYQPCEIIDIEPDVTFFNTWLFPNNTKKALIYTN